MIIQPSSSAPTVDVSIVPREAERLLQHVQDPRQRLMVENFRRHSMFEVSGRWPEIVDATMTTEHPVYRICAGPRTDVFDGHAEVSGFYSGMTDAGLNVLFPLWERMSTADWGIAFESRIAHFIPGPLMAMMGHEVSDTLITYMVTQQVSNVWPYSDEPKPRLLGEHVYIDVSSTEIFALEPEQVVTPERARAVLSPLVDALPTYADL